MPVIVEVDITFSTKRSDGASMLKILIVLSLALAPVLPALALAAF